MKTKTNWWWPAGQPTRSRTVNRLKEVCSTPHFSTSCNVLLQKITIYAS